MPTPPEPNSGPNDSAPSAETTIKPHGPFAAMRRVLPPAQVIRFLMVGGFNTGFSLALYSGFVLLYSHLSPHSGKPLIADLASISSKPIAIAMAFLCYKHFVFHTKGNYWKELLRCFAVYGVSTPAELIILPVCTKLFLLAAWTHPYAPFLAGIVNAVVIASYSYFAHKKFSFKK